MNHKTDGIAIIFSLAIIVILWRILIVPAGFFIAFAIGIIFFLTYRYLVLEEKELPYNPPLLRFKKTGLICLIVLSILSILFIPSISGMVEFIPWNKIPTFNLLRLLLSSFLTLFSPGYLILNLIGRNEKFTGTEKIFFSIMISLFILPFLGLLSFALGSSIQQLGIPSIFLLNLTLLIPSVFFKRSESKVNAKISIGLNEKLLLVSLVIFISTLMLSKYSVNLTWDYGDLNTYYGYSISFTKNVLPVSPIGPGLNYPFWPFIFLAESFILSGVPYVNAFQFISIPITFLPVLSFYIMVSAFFKRSRHRKIPIIASLLGFFGGGFGLIFGLDMLSNGQTVQTLYGLFTVMAKTDSGYLIPAFYSAGIYPLYTYALASIFALVWLIYSKRAIGLGNLRYVLISVMIALGFLAHIAETVFFIFGFLTSILIFKREKVSSYRKCAVSIIFGLLLIALPDIVIGGSYYTGGSVFAYYGFSLYYGALVLAALAFFLSFIKGHLKTPEVNLKMGQNLIAALKIACSGFIIYFYGLCLVIWSKVFETYNNLPIGAHTVPWYAWPNRLGICGLIALPGIVYLIHKNKGIKDYYFFVLLVPVSFIIARILHVVPSFYFEDRLTFFMMIPTVILASFVLLKFGQSLQKHVGNNVKNVVLGSVLLAILVLGFLPGLLTNEAMDLNYWSAGEKLTNSELTALNFLRLNTPSNCSVLTLTTRSNNLLSYAGLSDVQTYANRDPSLIFAPSYFETALYSLMKSQLKYVYLTSDDKQELEQNPSYSGFVRDYLLKYLPIAFQNEEITIYEVPDFSIPTGSNTALVTSNFKIGYFKDVFDESYDKYCRFCSVLTAGDIITLKTDNLSKNHDFELPVNVNPNEYPYVTVRWKTDGANLYFYLMGVNTVYYTLLGSSTTWQTTVINLQDVSDFVRNETIKVGPNEQIGSVLFRDFELNSEYSIDFIQFAGFSNNDSASEFLPLSMVALSQNEYATVLKNDPARFNYSTLILARDLNQWDKTEEQQLQEYMDWVNQGGHLVVLESSSTLPSYETRNWTESDYSGWKDENFTQWTTFECSAVSNGSGINVKTSNESIYHDFNSPPVNISVDSYQYVVIHWKTDGSPLFFYHHGTESGDGYIELGASTEWTTSIIDLKNFYDIVMKNYTGFKSDEQIDKMQFRSFVENATYSIDSIGFYKVYPLPPSLGFANALSIYSENNVKVDGIGSQTGDLSFPSMITVPVIHSSDVNVRIIANYTMNDEPVSPYALTKSVGNGEVTCLAVSPYFSAIENSTSDINRDFFKSMGSLLNVADLKLNKNIVERTYYFPQFDFTKDPVNFAGKVSIDTDFIQLPNLNASSMTIVSNNEETKSINFTDSAIEQVEYVYPVKFRIDASAMQLVGKGMGSYLNVSISSDFNLTMEIPKNSNVNMSIWNGQTLLNETFQDSNIQLSIKNGYSTIVSVKNPTVTTEGNAYFSSARIYRSYYKMPLFYDDGSTPFEVIGNTKFTIEYSDNGVSFVDNFSFNGKWSYPTTEQEQPVFTEMDIPWPSVLTSPFHELLVAIISIVIVSYVYLVFRRRARAKRNGKTERVDAQENTARYPLVQKSGQTCILMLQSEKTYPLMVRNKENNGET
jgi:hypothetical protein